MRHFEYGLILRLAFCSRRMPPDSGGRGVSTSGKSLTMTWLGKQSLDLKNIMKIVCYGNCAFSAIERHFDETNWSRKPAVPSSGRNILIFRV